MVDNYQPHGENNEELRQKIVRYIKKDDSVILDEYQIYHNFVNPYMFFDGKTPAEKCVIEIKGNNK